MNTWAEVMKEIGALEDRVEELEARIPAPEIRTRTARPEPALTETGRILVDPREYARLERIEQAACQLVSQLDEARTVASRDFYTVIISGMFDRLVLSGLRKDLMR